MRESHKIGVIVQARMSSTRLPGKVLRNLAGRPVLQRLLDQLSHSQRGGKVVIATTDESSDDPIVDFCKANQVPIHRGQKDDVAGRLSHAADKFGFDSFVRVCADSPLLDWRLVDRAIELFEKFSVDLVTNVMPRSFPKGQSVEVIDAALLRDNLPAMVNPSDREHVTRYFYQHAERFCIYNIAGGMDLASVHLTVDTVDDLQHLAALIAAMTRATWTYSLKEIVQLERLIRTGASGTKNQFAHCASE